MVAPGESVGNPHQDQTADLWERVGQGIHLRLRSRACGEMRAVRVLVGETTGGPHRDAGELMLTPGELAELHKTFKGGCGMHGWRSDVEIIEE